MHRALLGNRGDGYGSRTKLLVCGDQRLVGDGLRGDQLLLCGLPGGERLFRLGLPCQGLRVSGLRFGDLLLGQLLAGEVAERKYGGERTGLAEGLLGGDQACPGLLGDLGGLFSGDGQRLGLRGGFRRGDFRLGGDGRGGVSDLLQFFGLRGSLIETRPKRRGEFLAVRIDGGLGDRDGGVAILPEPDNGFALDLDQFLLGLDLSESLSLAETERRERLI